MLNLSDKELDRLSREAANEHDPGDLTGPRSWERLEPRLDKELGRIGPSPLRGVRRIPFYYAPVILLLVGVSYYLARHGKDHSAKTEPSGSPPTTVIKPLEQQNTNHPSTKTSDNSYNSTSKPDSSDNSSPYPASPESATSGAGSSPATTANHAPVSPAAGKRSSPATADPTISRRTPVSAPATPAAASGSTSPNNPGATDYAKAPQGKTSVNPNVSPSAESYIAGHNSRQKGTGDKTLTTSKNPHQSGNPNKTSPPSGSSIDTGSPNEPGASGELASSQKSGSPGIPGSSGESASTRESATPGKSGPTRESLSSREPARSLIQSPRSLSRSRGIDDSALRAFTLKGASASTPIRLDKQKNASLHINRPLQIGFSVSPDFSSVSSLAGDRPGSSIGLTLDYQFLDRLYLGTGLLLTRKTFASAPENYHVPDSYYRTYGNPHVDLVKGSFYMLEIPLNLRYDFNLSSSTVFFISGGASSYLMTSEHSQYYFDYFGRQRCLDFNKEPAKRNYLFSAVNLSMGVETGISNDLSLLVAPYVKIPTGGMGFGQVQITSVGINFALKYAPVISRKRHRP